MTDLPPDGLLMFPTELPDALTPAELADLTAALAAGDVVLNIHTPDDESEARR